MASKGKSGAKRGRPRRASALEKEVKGRGRPKGESPGDGWVRVEALAESLDIHVSALRKSLAGGPEVREGWVQQAEALTWRREQMRREAQEIGDLNPLDRARLRKIEKEIERLDLQVAELAGELIRIETHQSVVLGHAAVVRVHLEGLPKTIAAVCRSRKAGQAAEEAVRHCLETLASEMSDRATKAVEG